MSSSSSASPPAAEKVYQYLKRSIISGQMPGASMVSEGEIATLLGVSRTPVREAFLRLEVQGFMKLYPKRGALVQPITPGESDAVFDARQLIEAHAGEQICAHSATERERIAQRLETIIQEQSEAIRTADITDYVELDAAFHQEIIAAGDNPLLTDFSSSLRDRQQRLVAHSVKQDVTSADVFIEGHRLLIEHLRTGDATTFRQAITEHLKVARKVVE